jgi:GMP synthase-like glutamine amidotransferase
MKSLHVVQHTASENLGGVEEQLRQRGVGYQYQKPLTAGKIPTSAVNSDGLILLGGGAWGTHGERTTLPSLDQELRFAYDHLKRNRPVVGFGLGAQIICISAGGKTDPSGTRVQTGMARRVRDDALGGYMPESFPFASFMRDKVILPQDCEILAVDEENEPVVFSFGTDAICMTCHPGTGPKMLRALAQEVRAGEAELADEFAFVDQYQADMAAALDIMMTGISGATGWNVPDQD